MPKYMVSFESYQDFIFTEESKESAMKKVKIVKDFMNDSVKDLLLQHEIELHEDINISITEEE